MKYVCCVDDNDVIYNYPLHDESKETTFEPADVCEEEIFPRTQKSLHSTNKKKNNLRGSIILFLVLAVMFIGSIHDSMVVLLLSEKKELWWMDKDLAGRISLPQELLLPIQAVSIGNRDVIFIVDDDGMLWLLSGPSANEPSFVFNMTDVRFNSRLRLLHHQKVFLEGGNCLYLERDNRNITAKPVHDNQLSLGCDDTVQYQSFSTPVRVRFEETFERPISCLWYHSTYSRR